ncbi:BON domain-containing protein [Nitrosospira sp. Nsp13]|uniref:BON domain-containing protein n=1 Tax=Nitrosospira sp. Nsp13 TaxID=1855332 RepID=UPI0020C8B337|nr:BON domain-containing protein [Nitrosospira sp. Nsp13]
MIFGLKVFASLLNMFNSLIALFFAILMAGLPSCSTITEQEMGAHKLIREINTTDTDKNVDGAITARVKEAIYREPSLRDEGIGVETHQGTVRLKGAVSSILVMKKAIEIARGVKGVKNVRDEMQFKWQY